MTNFRFRYRRTVYLQWRCRAVRVRPALPVLFLESDSRCAPRRVVGRRTQPVVVVPPPMRFILQVGNYQVGEEGDPQLTGHPDIKY